MTAWVVTVAVYTAANRGRGGGACVPEERLHPRLPRRGRVHRRHPRLHDPHRDRIAEITRPGPRALRRDEPRGRAKGDIIGILNADDRFADNHVIADVLEAFEDTGADAIYADLDYVDEANGRTVTRRWKSGHPGDWRKGWMPPHPTLFVKRKLYEQAGLFNLQLKSAADYELMLRFFHFRGAELAYLPRVTVQMRAGGQSNVSLGNRLRANAEDARAWRLNGARPPLLLRLRKPLRKIGQFSGR